MKPRQRDRLADFGTLKTRPSQAVTLSEFLARVYKGNATWSQYELGYIASVLWSMNYKRHNSDKAGFHKRIAKYGDTCPICRKSL